MRDVGRTLLHAAVVGAVAGAFGIVFQVALSAAEHVLLERVVGFHPLRASGELVVGDGPSSEFRPWLLLVVPVLGACVCGWLCRIAPEARGGGGEQMIQTFHVRGGAIRPRVIWVKALASIATLGSGGSGGREGPTMLIGGALGAWVGERLRVTATERRILMVAGVAAGISAVFRTPLGAALLAVEILYRDDFETEALVPAVLASAVAYSIVMPVFGTTPLLAHAARYTFVPAHLILYALLAVLVALLAVVFVRSLHAVQAFGRRVRLAPWLHPVLGALALGLFAVPIILYVGNRIGSAGQGLGLLGGGYGAAQVAMNGSPFWSNDWRGVELLLLLCGGKLIATALTIGSGGSAGDFAPSLVLGGLLGGAFGLAARLVLGDPRIDPGAFALVGMGTFYGGIAHVPISSLVLVSELAGSFELLVPLMLAGGIAFVALRHRSLYATQPADRSDSPVHRTAARLEALDDVAVRDLVRTDRAIVNVSRTASLAAIVEATATAAGQDVFPVVGAEGRLEGLISSDTLRFASHSRELSPWAIADDIMLPPIAVRGEDDARKAASSMLDNGLNEIPVVDDDGRVVALLSEAEIFRLVLAPPETRTAQ